MLGALISAGSSLLGGLLSGNRQDETNRLALQDKAMDRAQQKEFAQNTIQWKSEDAKKAGINPYYALGASTTSYAPTAVGLGSDGGIGKGLSDSSQDIGRAVQATADNNGKDDAFTVATKKLALEKGALENQLLASQVRKNNQTGQKIAGPSSAPQLIDGQPATELTTPSGATVKPDDIKQQADTAPKHNRIRPVGIRLYTNPWMTDAEDLETRYGNVIENLGGIANVVGDAAYTGWKGSYYRRARNWYRDKFNPTFQQRFTGRR